MAHPPLHGISDDDLLATVRRLTAKSNVTLAELLAHLGEVEARGIHRARACATLYTYCIYELRMSEDAAYRRAKAARLVRQYPELAEMIAKGELHLTGVLMLGPHLGGERHAEILSRARFRSKREIHRLIARIDPKPEVPPCVEPLGPAPAGRATHAAQCESLAGPVRNLAPGERPEDWLEDDGSGPNQMAKPEHFTLDHAAEARTPEPETVTTLERPLHYKVQFTASQEYVNLMNEAFDLLGHEMRKPDLVELELRAMRELVRQLKKRKRAGTDGAGRRRGASTRSGDVVTSNGVVSTRGVAAMSVAPARGSTAKSTAPEPESGAPSESEVAAPARETAASKRAAARASGQRDNSAVGELGAPFAGRHIRAAVRRAVWTRDGARCAYVDARGRRCQETRALEIHHRHAHALGGPATVDNLELRCKPHNTLAAEEDFGRSHMDRKRGASDVSSLSVPRTPSSWV